MKKIFEVIILSSVFLVACGKNTENVNAKKNKERKNIENIAKRENIFSNNSIEAVLKIFSEKSEKNRISINKFEKLIFENRNYYYSKINSKEDSIYALDYSGINATGIFLKVNKVDRANLGVIENLVANLIQVSDSKLKDSEARAIYAEILSKLKDNELSSTLTYSNGITYGLQINSTTGEFVFFAKENDTQNASMELQDIDINGKIKIFAEENNKK
ncbi:lipoprotein [Leptotrichia sp. oral taxon 847]|uniref:lipoprotein n=1 Tax=Leptotrichia sp. oral taxon 847 TaxID=1785996 RepID=UPI0007680358|nr:lipoprotein [Leptotrichia sp. oral taxon 847]AMD95043.1 liporotein [Leptotrichia sp. oral taxon 847]